MADGKKMDDTPENGVILSAEAIKGQLKAAIDYLKSKGIKVDPSIEQMTGENVNGLSNAAMDDVIAKLSAAERSAGGKAVQEQTKDMIAGLVSPFKNIKNILDGGRDGGERSA